MVALPACLPSPKLEVWITKDHSGSRMWMEEPEWDLDMFHFIGNETMVVNSEFTSAWPNGACYRLEIRHPGKLF